MSTLIFDRQNYQSYQALNCNSEVFTTTPTATSTTTTGTTTTTSTTTKISGSDYPCIIDDSSKQYCYTIPDAYAPIDALDNNPLLYHVDENFNAGNEIRFSKVCSGDWYFPGEQYQKPDGSYILDCDHPDLSTKLCQWDTLVLLGMAVPSPDGYVTIHNCPVCGCTPGQNDALTMVETW